MEKDFIIENFTPPPHPKNIQLNGRTVRLEPLDALKHAEDLFQSNSFDREGMNWKYLPYGPFEKIEDYANWLQEKAKSDDPSFFAIIRLSDHKAVGIASFLRINPTDGSIEVGHINYSPLLQKTREGTEAMYLMMKWVFESGYRRYE
jgi:RimJ/RimL family protein N-acetyltransferase